jgi:ketosteroid isomerase-like protein
MEAPAVNTSDDKDEIRELMARYNLASDYPDLEAWLDCWADDGILALSGRPRVEGKEALREYGVHRPGGHLHLSLNQIIDIDGDLARATSYLALLSGEDDPAVRLAGRYDDELQRINGCWRFVLRTLDLRLVKGT